MNLNNLNDLPNWDDLDDSEDNEGEDWKPNPTRDACKKLYKKWNEIVVMLNGALQKELHNNSEKEYYESTIAMVLGDAYEVGAKIRSSDVMDMYVGRMENAAIIRKNAQFIQSSLLVFEDENILDKNYCNIIRDEIDIFRSLFKEWIATFIKDEFEDEWGLF